jgi:hypothetical protein
MELGGKTFAPPHLPHMFGTLGVNLPHLPYLPPPSKQLLVKSTTLCQFFLISPREIKVPLIDVDEGHRVTEVMLTCCEEGHAVHGMPCCEGHVEGAVSNFRLSDIFHNA